MCVCSGHTNTDTGAWNIGEIPSIVQIPPPIAEGTSGKYKGPGIFHLPSFFKTTFLLEDRHERLRQPTESAHIKKMRK